MKFQEYVNTIKHSEIAENSRKRLMAAVDSGESPDFDGDTVNEPVEVIGKQPIYRRTFFAAISASIAAAVLSAAAVTVMLRINSANEPISKTEITAENDDAMQEITEKLDIHFSDVTPRSIHITITDYNEPHLTYGRAYTIERRSDGEWQSLKPVIDNYAFASDAQLPDENGEITFDINWEWLYGALPEGEYTINLSAVSSDPNVTGNGYSQETVSLKFRISYEEIMEDYREKLDTFNRENGTHFRLLTEDKAAEYGVDMDEYRALFADWFSTMTAEDFSKYLEHLKFLRTDGSVRERLDKVNLEIEEEPVPDQPKTYDVNENGMTYGYSLDSVAYLPDLAAVEGDHGIMGYVYSYELITAPANTPEEALEYMESIQNGTYTPRILTVFASDGETILDIFTESVS